MYPIVQIYSSIAVAETLYLALLLAGLARLIEAARQGRRASFATLLAGFILIGLSGLARGNGLVFFLVLGPILMWRCDFRKVAIAGIIGAVPILFWSSLNYQWYGQFKPTSSGDANIAASLVGPAMALTEGRTLRTGPEVWIDGNWYDHYDNQFTFAKAMRDRAVAYAIEHPLPVIYTNAKGWLNGLVGPGAADLQQAFGSIGTGLAALSLVIRSTLLLGLVAFVVTGTWRRHRWLALILGIAVLAHIIAGGAAGFGRFGYPVDALSTLALLLALQARMRPIDQAASTTADGSAA